MRHPRTPETTPVPLLTDQAWQSVLDLARRYGVSPDAVTALLHAVSNGGGSMAQFHIGELGGGGTELVELGVEDVAGAARVVAVAVAGDPLEGDRRAGGVAVGLAARRDHGHLQRAGSGPGGVGDESARHVGRERRRTVAHVFVVDRIGRKRCS